MPGAQRQRELRAGEGEGGAYGIGEGRGRRGQPLGQTGEQRLAEVRGGLLVVEQVERATFVGDPVGVGAQGAVEHLARRFFVVADESGPVGPRQPRLDLGGGPVARSHDFHHCGGQFDLAQGHGDLAREGDAGFEAHDRLRKGACQGG